MGRGKMSENVFTFDEPGHVYKLNGVVLPSITQAIGEAGFVNTEFYTDEGRDRGTFVHDACWFYDENDFDWHNVDERLHGYVKAYIKFRKEADFEPDIIEKKYYDELFWFAGRPDRAGRLGKEPKAIVEIKTGKPGAFAAIQTAAQKILIEKHNPGYYKRFALELMSDGKYDLTPHLDPKDRNVFLASLTISHWRRKNGIKYDK